MKNRGRQRHEIGGVWRGRLLAPINDPTFPLLFPSEFPALLGVMLGFWPLVIVLIANSHKAMRETKVNPAVYDPLMQILPVVGAWLPSQELQSQHTSRPEEAEGRREGCGRAHQRPRYAPIDQISDCPRPPKRELPGKRSNAIKDAHRRRGANDPESISRYHDFPLRHGPCRGFGSRAG